MTLLYVAYTLNIVVLIPVALVTLLGGESGNRRIFEGKFPESEGVRMILGSLWTAILIGSCIGLVYPVQMSPVFLLQVVYKSVWLLAFVLPRVAMGRAHEVPWGLAVIFLVVVVGYPWIIPWTLLFGVV